MVILRGRFVPFAVRSAERMAPAGYHELVLFVLIRGKIWVS